MTLTQTQDENLREAIEHILHGINSANRGNEHNAKLLFSGAINLITPIKDSMDIEKGNRAIGG